MSTIQLENIGNQFLPVTVGGRAQEKIAELPRSTAVVRIGFPTILHSQTEEWFNMLDITLRRYHQIYSFRQHLIVQSKKSLSHKIPITSQRNRTLKKIVISSGLYYIKSHILFIFMCDRIDLHCTVPDRWIKISISLQSDVSHDLKSRTQGISLDVMVQQTAVLR